MAGASRGTGSQSDDGLDDAVVVRSTRIVWCVALMLLAFGTWAYLFEIDEVSTGTGKVIPSSREQVIQSLEGGIVTELNVAEGDIVKVEKIEGELGSSVALTPVLLVDGATVTTKADELAKVKVSAEIIDSVKGPKIKILKYKNKTGYKKRQGHRQPLTVLKITGIK